MPCTITFASHIGEELDFLSFLTQVLAYVVDFAKTVAGLAAIMLIFMLIRCLPTRIRKFVSTFADDGDRFRIVQIFGAVSRIVRHKDAHHTSCGCRNRVLPPWRYVLSSIRAGGADSARTFAGTLDFFKSGKGRFSSRLFAGHPCCVQFLFADFTGYNSMIQRLIRRISSCFAAHVRACTHFSFCTQKYKQEKISLC